MEGSNSRRIVNVKPVYPQQRIYASATGREWSYREGTPDGLCASEAEAVSGEAHTDSLRARTVSARDAQAFGGRGANSLHPNIGLRTGQERTVSHDYLGIRPRRRRPHGRHCRRRTRPAIETSRQRQIPGPQTQIHSSKAKTVTTGTARVSPARHSSLKLSAGPGRIDHPQLAGTE